MTRTVLRVDGMSCDHCVKSIATALEGLPGVSAASVSLENERALVDHEESRPTLAEMIAAVEEEGYNASGE